MTHPYRDRDLSVDERVEDLLGRMTAAEKVAQMLQLPTWDHPVEVIEEYEPGSILHNAPTTTDDAIDAAARTRLGIPLLIADDCIRGHSFWEGATLYPSQLSQACSWNAELIETAARQAAVEISATGVVWTFSPVLCIARELRWGRVDETFGEDPFLIGEFATAMIRGYQGESLTDPTAVMACAKHYAGYSETQGGRDASEADLSRRKLRSWFLPPFEQAARAGSATFMLGYQSMDGVPITINAWALTDVLKGEWGFDGLLVTDWDNVGRMVWEQKICPDYTDAAARAIDAGNDLIMSTPKFHEGALDALARGLVSEDQIDAAVRRILTVKFRLGLFENPRRPDLERQRVVIGCDEHRATNRKLNDQALVLLENSGLLPLDEAPRTIAVIGPNADDIDAQIGDWAGRSGQGSWLTEPPEGVTVLAGLRAAVPKTWTVTHAAGAEIVHAEPYPPGTTLPDGQPMPDKQIPSDPDEDLLAEAVAAAEAADVVVAVIGDNIHLTGEYRSTATLELVGAQKELLRRLAALGRPTVVVLINSKPLVLPPEVLDADAIIEAFNPGQRGGESIADLILGRIEPSGRLPITIPRHVGQLPVYYNQVRGQHGDRYADLTQEPQWPFGHGLSYTTVEYRDLVVDTPEVGVDGVVRAHVTVGNIGARPAREVVQVYVRDVVTSVTWADKELKAFQVVELAPGTEQEVVLEVPVSACTLVDADGVRRVEPGEFTLLVGPNSRDVDLLSGSFVVS